MKHIICDLCKRIVMAREKDKDIYPKHWIKYEKDREQYDFCSKKCLLDWLIKVVKGEARTEIEER